VGSFLEVKLPDCEADQKCYLLWSQGMSEVILLSPVHFHGFESEILGRILEPGGVLNAILCIGCTDPKC
jgi:hypothetical protein